MSCHAMLEEIDAEYSLNFIDLGSPWPEEYKTLNPNLKVPTLLDNQRSSADNKPLVIYQSAAILLYLHENHPQFNLVPESDTVQRAACYQQLFFMAETLQPAYMMYFYPHRYTRDDADSKEVAAVAEKATQSIRELWGRLDNFIGDNEFMLGDSISVCDLFILPMAYWNRNAEFKSLDNCKNIQRLLKTLHQRPAIQRMMEQHTNE
jgi:glutathione S-transferase